MRRDHTRLVYRNTKPGDIFTARQLAEKIGLTSFQVAGALKLLKGIAIDIAKPRTSTQHCHIWIRTHLQDLNHRYLNET